MKVQNRRVEVWADLDLLIKHLTYFVIESTGLMKWTYSDNRTKHVGSFQLGSQYKVNTITC